MTLMVDAFSWSRTTSAAKSQTPKRAAATPLAPVSAGDGVEAEAPAGVVAAELEPVEAEVAAAPDDVELPPAEDGTVTAIASICAFSALALESPLAFWLVKVAIVARRLLRALISSISPCNSEIFACNAVFCCGRALASWPRSESNSVWTAALCAENLSCSCVNDCDEAGAPAASFDSGFLARIAASAFAISKARART